jgi:tetratricopeptide (TPR) repeat protein
MKRILLLLFFLLPAYCFAQQMSYEDFQEKAKTEINLQPEYGNVPKSKAQKDDDKEFIAATLKIDTTMEHGSEHLVKLGFNYLGRGDMETAMRRFNQAWLLNPKNENVYWGYGAVYATFQDYQLSLKMYAKALTLNPKNSNVLISKGSIYLMFYENNKNSESSEDTLNTAIKCLKKAYDLDNTNQIMLYKLSVCYWYAYDCTNALKCYDECEKLGGKPITAEYTKLLMQTCKK